MATVPSCVTVLLLGAVALLSDAQTLRLSLTTAREVLSYRAYKDVTILPYNIPEQTRFVSFNFSVSEELIYSGVNICKPRNVSVAVKSGSFPVINPDGTVFPDHYLTIRVPLYRAEFLSDNTPYVLNISNPTPGDWYAVVFLSYTDPNDDKILQQGLSVSCRAAVESSVNVVLSDDVTTVTPEQELHDEVESKVGKEIMKNYKFFVPLNTWKVLVNVTVDQCKANNCPSLNIVVSARSFPVIEIPGTNSSLQGYCGSENITQGESCVLEFAPAEDVWHYLTLASAPSKKSSRKNIQAISYSIRVSLQYDSFHSEFLSGENDTGDSNGTVEPSQNLLAKLECEQCWPRVPLMRVSYPAFFLYNYVCLPDENNKLVTSINITTGSPTLLRFEVFPVKDVGGTLTFELRLDKDPALSNVTAHSYNVSVVSCLSLLSRSVPQFPDTCLSNSGVTSSASVKVNSTASASRMGKIHVPFPEPGHWFVSLQPFCFVQNNSSSLETDSYTEVDCTELNVTTISFIIDSESCGPDSCGRFGHCFNYMSGGVIFSTCVCNHGYGGWGCTDDSKITPLSELLVAALLLTLSNLLFIPAVLISLRRRYWTEAFVYACTMFFSTFYHACEAGEDVYYYCMMRLGVLQFCDFYSAILSLWVTLIAMADLSPTLRSLAHMAGAIGIALGTEYDRTSLAMFMVPTLVGLAIVSAHWGFRCRKHRSCYPHKNYWKYFFPPGVVLVLVGIVCYSFLQTRNNYKFVHSAWHAIMAIAITLVLPMKEYIAVEAVESDESLNSSMPFWKRKKLCLCKFW